MPQAVQHGVTVGGEAQEEDAQSSLVAALDKEAAITIYLTKAWRTPRDSTSSELAARYNITMTAVRDAAFRQAAEEEAEVEGQRLLAAAGGAVPPAGFVWLLPIDAAGQPVAERIYRELPWRAFTRTEVFAAVGDSCC